MAHFAQVMDQSSDDVSFDALAREVDAVAAYINELRSAINGLGILDMTNRKLSAAQIDLNEVIIVTRNATDAVLETAEALLATPLTNNEYRTLVEERMIGLMEACSFQDLTGQRLTRVSQTLGVIEERLKTFATSARAKPSEPQRGTEETKLDDWKARHLLHGPGSPDGLEQDSVDNLLRFG